MVTAGMPLFCAGQQSHASSSHNPPALTITSDSSFSWNMVPRSKSSPAGEHVRFFATRNTYVADVSIVVTPQARLYKWNFNLSPTCPLFQHGIEPFPRCHCSRLESDTNVDLQLLDSAGHWAHVRSPPPLPPLATTMSATTHSLWGTHLPR